MKRYLHFSIIIFLCSFSGCIGDDVIFDTVEETVKITNSLDSLATGETYQFEAVYFDNIGREQPANFLWAVSDTSLMGMTSSGMATGKTLGEVTVTAMLGENTAVRDSIRVVVGNNTTVTPQTERNGMLKSTSSYALEGSFSLKKNGLDLELTLAEDYKASSALPGLYVYLSNNPNTTSNAVEISEVTIFSGAHSYRLPGNIGLNDYQYVLYFCKPFNVKVGDGKFDE